MKRVVALTFLMMVAFTVSAQIVVHDYVWISTFGSSIYIASTEDDERVIDIPKGERLGITAMHKAAMMVVQEYEANGWVLFSFDSYHREAEFTARMTWIMRKPKQ